MSLLWLSWELWTLNKCEYSSCLPLVTLMMFQSPTARPCFRSVTVINDAQTVHKKKRGSSFPPWRDALPLKNDVLHCLSFAIHAALCLTRGVFRTAIATWNPACSVERDSHKDKRGRLVCPAHPSWASLSIATRRRRRRREKTIGLCDPCGEHRLRVRESTRLALNHSAVTSHPRGQISVQTALTRTVTASEERPALFRLDFCVN